MPDSEWVRKFCRSFPEVTEDMPWADDLCFKVGGKIFTGMVLADGRFPRITLKCTPERFRELLEMEGISIAPYVGRYNWVTLANPPNVLPADELETLIRQSYELVASKAPKKSVKKKVKQKAARKKKSDK